MESLLAARKTEFAHAEGVTYLDHAGATLYSSVQLQSYLSDLTSHLYGNPHSQNPSSKLSSDVVEQTRERVLNHFNTSLSDYDIIFTSGCTGALHLLADSFPWAGLGGRSLCSHSHSSKDVQRTSVLYLPHQVPTREQTEQKQMIPGVKKGTSVFCYLEDNHTSVVGMREAAASHGAKIVCATDSSLIPSPERDTIDIISQNEDSPSNSTTKNAALSPTIREAGHTEFTTPLHLFAYPAQSNFCGHKYPLSWTRDIPDKQLVFESLPTLSGSWLVALDAASLVSTSPLDLSAYPAHFVAVSFYKMFGFPTGLGALLVRRDCCGLMEKEYYGGGTVAATLSRERFHVPRTELHDRLEDGTLPFLSIVALSHGFDALCRIGRSMEDISLRTFKLAQYVHSSLACLRHDNGQPVCTLYCRGKFSGHSEQGPIVNFNLIRPDGRVVGYSEVDKLACVYNIHLRTGCFCNTGACMSYLEMSAERVKEHLKAGHVCGDSLDIVDGEPTGSVRVSFGYTSTLQDAQTLVHFIESCFVDHGQNYLSYAITEAILCAEFEGLLHIDYLQTTAVDTSTVSSPGPAVSGVKMHHDFGVIRVGDLIEACGKDKSFDGVAHLTRLALYPIKSCGSQVVSSWPVGEKGLLYDREWVVVGETGSVLSQKQEGRLCLVQPSVDIQAHTLSLSFPGHRSLILPLEADGEKVLRKSVSTRVCGDRVIGVDCGEEVAEWLTQALNRRCRLLRQSPGSQRVYKKPHNERGSSLSLANEAQYLLISDSSVKHLCTAVQERGLKVKLSMADCISRFRPNFVVSAVCGAQLESYVEEEWERVSGLCSRCQMICVDPSTGGRSPEPLKTLMELRGSRVWGPGVQYSTVSDIQVPFGLYLSRNIEL